MLKRAVFDANDIIAEVAEDVVRNDEERVRNSQFGQLHIRELQLDLQVRWREKKHRWDILTVHYGEVDHSLRDKIAEPFMFLHPQDRLRGVICDNVAT